jgi:tetratricopeptide (TPR) repeat protein
LIYKRLLVSIITAVSILLIFICFSNITYQSIYAYDTIFSYLELNYFMAQGMTTVVSLNDNSNTSTQKYNDAIVIYDKALSITPDDPDILTNKGKVLAKLNKYHEAIQSFDKVLSVDPNHVGALYNKGEVLKELGETVEAQEYYERALELDPTYAGGFITNTTRLNITGSS